MTWKTVCSVGDIETDAIKKFDIDGISIVVVNTGDEFKALPPMCPHMEEELAESGVCVNGTMTCTKHLWQWDLKTGTKQGPAEKDILMYDVKCEAGEVLVSIEEELTYEFDEEDDDDFEW